MSLQSTVNGPLSGCHAETYQPHLGFHLRSTNTATQVYSKISMFARVLALSQKHFFSVYFCLCVHVGDGEYLLLWIVYQIPET